MDIHNCIAELLSLHDCVIIPGFGGFIGNYTPARIDPVHHTFQPPAKKLLFNINLKQNDGLLANAIALSLGTSYQDACKLIEEYAETCRLTLKTGSPFHIPQVGQLYSGNEGIIYFEQDKSTNLLPDSFGLTQFISPPVSRYVSFPDSGANHPVFGNESTGKRFAFPRILKWAAAIVLPIGIATVIGVTQYDKLSANFANNAGILSSVFSRAPETSAVIKKEVQKNLPAVIVTTPTAPVEAKPEIIRHDDPYAVIVGAFRVKENAEKLVAELQQKGIEASIFDQSRTGLFRVTIGTSSDRDGANQMLASAKSTDFTGAWILAK